MAEMSDAELVRRIRAGQTSRFRELVERYQASIFAVAVSRLGRREDVLSARQFDSAYWTPCRSGPSAAPGRAAA